MKKIITAICFIITMCFIINASYACENTIFMPKEKEENEYFSENTCDNTSYWIITSEHSIVGIMKSNEEKNVFPMYGTENTYVRGIVDNGIIRAKGVAKICQIEETWYGLTSFETNVCIYQQYIDLVKTIVNNRIETTVFNCQSIIASTIWKKNSHAAHIFFVPNSDIIEVGYVTFVKQNVTATLYAGYFEGSEELVLGFLPGSCPVVTTPEPTVVPTNEPEVCSTPEPNITHEVIENQTVICKEETTKTTTKCVRNVYNSTIVNVGMFENVINTINNNSKQIVNFQSTISPVVINPILKNTLLNQKSPCNK